MSVFCKRRRELIAPLTLALWLFAIFVGIANACGLDHAVGNQAPAIIISAAAQTMDDPSSPACEQFCADDTPVQAKIKAIQDPPSGGALLAIAFVGPSLQSSGGSSALWLPSLHPPAAVEVTILFLRLAL